MTLRDDDTASQNHFRIGEVADLVGVRPHVLRYWEQEFSGLRPKKTRGAHRHYSRANLALAKTIRSLVVDQGYSIAGARKRIHDEGLAGMGASSDSTAALFEVPASAREVLISIRAELSDILLMLDGLGQTCASEALEGLPPPMAEVVAAPVSATVLRESVRHRR